MQPNKMRYLFNKRCVRYFITIEQASHSNSMTYYLKYQDFLRPAGRASQFASQKNWNEKGSFFIKLSGKSAAKRWTIRGIPKKSVVFFQQSLCIFQRRRSKEIKHCTCFFQALDMSLEVSDLPICLDLLVKRMAALLKCLCYLWSNYPYFTW